MDNAVFSLIAGYSDRDIKVIEDVNAAYPGAGRGVIQLVESVNKPYYCPTDKSRDALVVAGSDERGTLAALKLLVQLLRGS